MPGLPFFDEAAPQPVRAPRVEVNISSASDSGGVGGLVDAATSLLGASAASSWGDFLVSMSIHRGFAPAVDFVELLLVDREDAPIAELGDNGSISMGSVDAMNEVFNGAVIAVERRTDGLRRYRLANTGSTLAQTRINQTVNDMSVADAINFAAGESDFSVESAISGPDGSMPQYVFHDARNLWEHIAYLAGLRAANVWCDETNQLHLADQLEQGDSVATVSWGQDLLEAKLWQRSPHSGAITAIGSSRVDDGFVLRKQSAPNQVAQGDGFPQRFYRDAVLQSQQDLSARAAAAGLYGHRRTTEGSLSVSGSSLFSPGAVVMLAEGPSFDEGLYLIASVTHTFDRQSGWLSRLTVSEAGDSAGLGDLLGGLGDLL